MNCFGVLRRFHIGKNSSHNYGLAFDATPNARMTHAQMVAVPEKIKAYLANLGFSEKDFFVQFEHAGKRNKNGTVSTGNHWHFNWRNKEAAAKFASLNDGSAKAFSKAGLYKEFDPPKTVKKSDFEQYQEQAQAKQLRAQIERELRAKGEHRVIDNERDLRSRPEFKNWTKSQQNSELAKARQADELATQEKIKSLADAQIAQLTQKQALMGKNTEMARLQYELDSGSLKHLSDVQKAEILARQQAIDTAQKQYETNKKYADLLDDLAIKTNEQFNQKAFELSLVGKSKVEIEKLTLAREYDMKIMQAASDGASAVYINALGQQKVAAEQARVEFAKLKQEHDENWVAGMSDGLVSYIGSFKSMREEVSSMVEQTTGRMADSLAEFVATGKANFRDFSKSVLEDISKMMIKMAIFNAMKSASSAMSGQGGWIGAMGSALSSAFSDGGYTGHGGKYEPAGIVHKGEYVLSQENLRTLGGVGAVVTRRQTYAQFLDAVNFTAGNSKADSTQEIVSKYLIERLSSLNAEIAVFELSAPSEADGAVIPARVMLANVCVWQYRGAECGYMGKPVADRFGMPTSDPTQDACGGRLLDCQARFGKTAVLPFGAFPSCDKVS